MFRLYFSVLIVHIEKYDKGIDTYGDIGIGKAHNDRESSVFERGKVTPDVLVYFRRDDGLECILVQIKGPPRVGYAFISSVVI